MNSILVSSAGTIQEAPQRIYFEGPTYIDCYVEKDKANYLEDEINGMLKAEISESTPHYSKLESYDSPHGFSYNHKVKLPPLAVLQFLKQYGYNVVGTNTIGDTCIWTLQQST